MNPTKTGGELRCSGNVRCIRKVIANMDEQ